MRTPSSLRAEHEELMATLERAVREEGAIGDAARAVEAELRPHLEKEEEFVLPPLGALTLTGESDVDPERVIAMTGRLREELQDLLDDHVRIAVALERLSEEARRVGRAEYERFAHALLQHARLEEEVLYPASLLIGSYVRQKMLQRA